MLTYLIYIDIHIAIFRQCCIEYRHRIEIEKVTSKDRSITIIEALLILYSMVTVFVYIAYNNRCYYYCY